MLWCGTCTVGSSPKTNNFQPLQHNLFRSAKWFLAAYVRDVWSWLPSLQAAVTSIVGRILKIDSTKKVCKKQQVTSVTMATWTYTSLARFGCSSSLLAFMVCGAVVLPPPVLVTKMCVKNVLTYIFVGRVSLVAQLYVTWPTYWSDSICNVRSSEIRTHRLH